MIYQSEEANRAPYVSFCANKKSPIGYDIEVVSKYWYNNQLEDPCELPDDWAQMMLRVFVDTYLGRNYDPFGPDDRWSRSWYLEHDLVRFFAIRASALEAAEKVKNEDAASYLKCACWYTAEDFAEIESWLNDNKDRLDCNIRADLEHFLGRKL